MGNAIGHCFDEDGAPAIGERQLARFLGHLEHGPDVVAVDADRVDSVAGAAAGDAVAAVLFQRGGRDGVPVVATDEDYGAGARGGYVEGAVEISF